MTPTKEPIPIPPVVQAIANDIYFEEERRLMTILRRCMFNAKRELAKKTYEEYFGPADKRREEIAGILLRLVGDKPLDAKPQPPMDKESLLKVLKLLHVAELNSFGQRVIRMDPEEWEELQSKLIESVGEDIVAVELGEVK